MTWPPPPRPKIYHITHVDNLASIAKAGGLVSDAHVGQIANASVIGMSAIKQRRLSLPVTGHHGLMVGACVPFYFCPRSIMLYVIRQGNHPELSYRGGQGPIVHLEADLHDTIAWAQSAKLRWAFSLSNAGAIYTQFRKDVAHLDQVNWPAVAATDFRPPDIKEGKQAEFLVETEFPWSLVQRIGVRDQSIGQKAHQSLAGTSHLPNIQIIPSWYF